MADRFEENPIIVERISPQTSFLIRFRGLRRQTKNFPRIDKLAKFESIVVHSACFVEFHAFYLSLSRFLDRNLCPQKSLIPMRKAQLVTKIQSFIVFAQTYRVSRSCWGETSETKKLVLTALSVLYYRAISPPPVFECYETRGS